MMPILRRVSLVFLLLGCSHAPLRSGITLAPYVDLNRFMGDWYVIASIPIWVENESYNGLESYRLDSKGRIQTTYTFRKGSFTGPLKTYRPVGTVYNRVTNSEWRMQFLWPFKAAYLIHYVDDAYTTTIVGEPKLHNVWIMARSPHPSEDTIQALITRAAALGYDITRLRRVPQS